MLKDGWVRCQACDGKFIDVALEDSVFQQVTCYVVEPQALPEIMEFLGWLHRSSCSLFSNRPGVAWWDALTKLRGCVCIDRHPLISRHGERRRGKDDKQ